MAQAAKKHTSLVKNTARPLALKGNAAKSKKRSKTRRRRNPAQTASNPARRVRSRRRYRRNAAGGVNIFGAVLAAFGGALAITGFDAVINRFAPNTSALYRTLGKAAAGLGFMWWGRKIPVIGRYSNIISYAFFFATGLDLAGTYVLPPVLNAIDSARAQLLPSFANPAANPQPVGQVTNPTTGELGQAYRYGDNIVEVYPSQGALTPGQRPFAYA